MKNTNELKNFSIYHTHVFSASKLFINGKLLLEKGKISSDLTKLVSNRTNSHVKINTQDHYLEIIMQIANMQKDNNAVLIKATENAVDPSLYFPPQSILIT